MIYISVAERPQLPDRADDSRTVDYGCKIPVSRVDGNEVEMGRWRLKIQARTAEEQ